MVECWQLSFRGFKVNQCSVCSVRSAGGSDDSSMPPPPSVIAQPGPPTVDSFAAPLAPGWLLYMCLRSVAFILLQTERCDPVSSLSEHRIVCWRLVRVAATFRGKSWKFGENLGKKSNTVGKVWKKTISWGFVLCRNLDFPRQSILPLLEKIARTSGVRVNKLHLFSCMLMPKFARIFLVSGKWPPFSVWYALDCVVTHSFVTTDGVQACVIIAIIILVVVTGSVSAVVGICVRYSVICCV